MTESVWTDRPRCDWKTTDPLYLSYHDTEWGRPVHDSRQLFAMLCLEGMQAGLSWLTVLKRREAYYEAFADFDPEQIATFSQERVEELMANAAIIRNRRKITAIIQNARGYLQLEKETTFSNFLWSFVAGSTQHHRYTAIEQVPAASAASRAMSRALKQRGYKFVGETICYAFMQAVGMVNDHLTSCFCYDQIVRLDAQDKR
ncbi:MAG: DNA-3-methyladenine glycosylase I [Sporolactobacillus sp.]